MFTTLKLNVSAFSHENANALRYLTLPSDGLIPAGLPAAFAQRMATAQQWNVVQARYGALVCYHNRMTGLNIGATPLPTNFAHCPTAIHQFTLAFNEVQPELRLRTLDPLKIKWRRSTPTVSVGTVPFSSMKLVNLFFHPTDFQLPQQLPGPYYAERLYTYITLFTHASLTGVPLTTDQVSRRLELSGDLWTVMREKHPSDWSMYPVMDAHPDFLPNDAEPVVDVLRYIRTGSAHDRTRWAALVEDSRQQLRVLGQTGYRNHRYDPASYATLRTVNHAAVADQLHDNWRTGRVLAFQWPKELA